MKNTVVIPAIQNKELNKFGGWSWMDYSITAWKYWCKQNDCQLVVYDAPQSDDITKHRVTWQRWFDVFEFLDNKDIQYDKILMTDACSIPKWNCPNFFNLVGNDLLNNVIIFLYLSAAVLSFGSFKSLQEKSYTGVMASTGLSYLSLIVSLGASGTLILSI